jgi:hypothetical protein
MATTTPISVFGLLKLPPVCPQNRPVSERPFLIFGHAGIRSASDPLKGRQARPSTRDRHRTAINPRRTGINDGAI